MYYPTLQEVILHLKFVNSKFAKTILIFCKFDNFELHVDVGR